MPKEKHITKYECSICGKTYSTLEQATKCESRPVRQDKGVKIGDEVLILNGAGQGKKAKVRRTYVVDMEWGHYAWDRYWHTVSVEADIIGEYGTRNLTFDSYEPVRKS